MKDGDQHIGIEGWPIRKRVCHGRNGPILWYLGIGEVGYMDSLKGVEVRRGMDHKLQGRNQNRAGCNQNRMHLSREGERRPSR